MISFFVYLLKTAVIYGFCYLLFLALFSRETFFRRNRIFLLLSFLLPLVIPLINFEGRSPVEHMGLAGEGLGLFFMSSSGSANSFIETAPSASLDSSSGMGFLGMLGVVYLIGLAFFLLRLIFSYAQLIQLINLSQRTRLQRMILVLTARPVSPFSLFKWLVISKNQQTDPNMDKIIRHEMIHFVQGHSVDVLIGELILAFQWFNPFVWKMKSAMVRNNEFIVDHELLKQQGDAKSYQLALLNIGLNQQQLRLANGFNRGLIKKRIEMMNKKETALKNKIKNTLILPFAALLVIAFASYSGKVIDSEKYQSDNDLEFAEVTQAIDQDQVKKDSLKKRFNIYIDGKMISIKDFDKYTSGEGDIRLIDLEKLKGIDGELTKEKIASAIADLDIEGGEAVLMIKRAKGSGEDIEVFVSSKSKVRKIGEDAQVIHVDDLDGKVLIFGGGEESYTIYRRDKDGKTTSLNIKEDLKGRDFLYVIDGEIVDAETLEDFDADKIWSISILDKEKSVEKYGEKAKGGVLELRTKK